MTDVGFAIGRLILTAQEVADRLAAQTIDTRYGTRKALADKLRAALEDVGVEHRASNARQLMEDPPLIELGEKVPLVLYFASRADAEEFSAVVSSVMVNPVEVYLAPKVQ